jgi:hypothetical protein
MGGLLAHLPASSSDNATEKAGVYKQKRPAEGALVWWCNPSVWLYPVIDAPTPRGKSWVVMVVIIPKETQTGGFIMGVTIPPAGQTVKKEKVKTSGRI